MVRMSDKASQEIESLLKEFDGDMFALTDEYYNHGICCSCGNLQSGVEPDAKGYECDSCGKHGVVGIESAMLYLM